MHVETVTTSDRSLLHAVRSTLDGAEEVFLCVAFVQEKVFTYSRRSWTR